MSRMLLAFLPVTLGPAVAFFLMSHKQPQVTIPRAIGEILQAYPKVEVQSAYILDEGGVASAVRKLGLESRDRRTSGIVMKCRVRDDAVAEITGFRASLRRDPELQCFSIKVSL